MGRTQHQIPSLGQVPDVSGNIMTAQELLTEFSSVVDEIHQLYLDCSLGFVHNKKVMEDSQGKSVEKLGLKGKNEKKQAISKVAC